MDHAHEGWSHVGIQSVHPLCRRGPVMLHHVQHFARYAVPR